MILQSWTITDVPGSQLFYNFIILNQSSNIGRSESLTSNKTPNTSYSAGTRRSKRHHWYTFRFGSLVDLASRTRSFLQELTREELRILVFKDKR